MPERVIGFFQPVKDKWNALEQVQKIRIAAVILVVLIALAITLFFTTRTVYRVAINDLSNIDAMQVATLMEENDIRHRLTQNGTAVEVDQNQLNNARVLIDTRGLVPDRDFTYEDALNFSGIGATETVTRQNLLRAKQSDLERAVMSMDSVLSAQVELVIPDANRFFVQTSEAARASVIVRTTRRLTSAEGAGIARFISRSVMGLEMENIEVMDTDFNPLFSGQIMEEDDSLVSDLMELMVRERLLVSGQVRDLFRNVFDSVEVAPNLIYRGSITDAERVTWGVPLEDAEQGLLITEETMRASAQGNQAAIEPGIMPNAATFPSYPFMAGGDMRASQDEARRNFALNEFRESIREIPTGFQRDESTIAVTLERFVVHSQEAMERRNGGTFTQDDWDDHVVSTIPTLVDDEVLLETYRLMISNATGIPLDNVTVVSWIIPQFVEYDPTPVAFGQLIMYAILALLLGLLAFGLVRRTQPVEDDEIEPELSVEDLLVSTQMEEAIEEEMLDPIGYEEGSEAKRKLDEFIDEKPEAAASLLRHWLNEAEF